MLEAGFFSDVIGFRLEQVIIPSWLCSEVVVRSACTLTTTPMLWAGGEVAMPLLAREVLKIEEGDYVRISISQVIKKRPQKERTRRNK
jgi:hypothetical protein